MPKLGIYQIQKNMAKIDLNRIPEYFHKYVNLVQDDNLHTAFNKNSETFIDFLKKIPAEKLDYRYAEDKWTIKEILQHIIDAERVFAYRALRFSRNDDTPLPGFNENHFAKFSSASDRKWEDLVEEFSAVRRSTELLFTSFNESQLNSEGVSNTKSVYVMGIGYICVGHCLHHQKIIEERYL